MSLKEEIDAMTAAVKTASGVELMELTLKALSLRKAVGQCPRKELPAVMRAIARFEKEVDDEIAREEREHAN